MATGDKLVNLEVLKETVQKEVVDLKSAVDTIPAFYKIKYSIILNNGKWSTSNIPNGYILIKSGSIVHIKANASKACYYAVLKSLDGMTTGSTADYATGYNGLSGVGVNSEVYFTVPSDANYLYVYVSDATFIPAVLTVDDVDIFSSIRENIAALYKSANYLADNKIINAYDENELVNDYIINFNNGEAISNQYSASYAVTDYIPLNFGDTVHLAYVRGTNLCGGALYDANKTFIKAIWGTDNWTKPSTDGMKDFTFVVDDRNVKYIRYNVAENALFNRYKQYLWITPNKAFAISDKQFTVGSGEAFTTIKGVLDYINDNGIKNATVYVKPGNYDLVAEFGQSYLDSITQTTNRGIGLFLGNNTHIIFSEGAYVKFNYNGTNLAVCEYFSPFNITGSFVMENADIEVTNARYCVHEDLPASATVIPSEYTAVYKNCIMRHNGNTVGAYTGTVCIGGGCMPNGLSIIDGGKYTCGNQYPRAISYHNYNTEQYGDHPSRVVLKNVWINNALRLGTFSDSIVDVEISGSYIPNGIYDGDDNYFNVTQWNNIGIT